MKVTTVLGALAAAVLFFFGLIFAIAASENTTRLAVALALFALGFAITYVTYVSSRKPTKIIQQLELSGQMKAATIKCPHCSASVDARQIHIEKGVPYATCPYCGTTFEVVEEPKW